MSASNTTRKVTAMKDIEWSGKIPDCDICKEIAGPYDAKTIYGPWANMCYLCMMISTSAEGRDMGTKKLAKS